MINVIKFTNLKGNVCYLRPELVCDVTEITKPDVGKTLIHWQVGMGNREYDFALESVDFILKQLGWESYA